MSKRQSERCSTYEKTVRGERLAPNQANDPHQLRAAKIHAREEGDSLSERIETGDMNERTSNLTSMHSREPRMPVTSDAHCCLNALRTRTKQKGIRIRVEPPDGPTTSADKSGRTTSTETNPAEQVRQTRSESQSFTRGRGAR